MSPQASDDPSIDLRSSRLRDKLGRSEAIAVETDRRPIDSRQREVSRRSLVRPSGSIAGLADVRRPSGRSRGDRRDAGQRRPKIRGMPGRPGRPTRTGRPDRRLANPTRTENVAIMDTANGRASAIRGNGPLMADATMRGRLSVGPATGGGAAALADRAGRRGARRGALGRAPELRGAVDAAHAGREHRRARGLGRHRVLLPDGPRRPVGLAGPLRRLQHGARPPQEGRGGHAARRRRRADATLSLPRPARRHPDGGRGIPPADPRVVDLRLTDPAGRLREDRARVAAAPGPVGRGRFGGPGDLLRIPGPGDGRTGAVRRGR